MQRLQYRIKGMSCAACVAHVERAVRSVLSEGDKFTVSLLTNSLSVIPEREFSSNEERERLEGRLSAAIRAAGYELLADANQIKKQDGESKKSRKKLILSAIFTILVMYISMGGMMGLPIPPFLSGAENALWMAIAQLILTAPVLFLNFKFFKNGFSALFHRAPNMDSLIAVGSGSAVIYGVVAIFMLAFANQNTEVIHSWMHDLYFESAAMILTLVSFGKYLESGAKDKAADAVTSLATLSPKFASVLRDGKETSVSVDEVQVGDILLIRAGELIPVDGEVIEGNASADESALTGESMPVEKCPGDRIHAACVLTSGFLRIRATEVGEDTSLSRIIRLLEDAAASKAPIARIADKVSAVFVPCVMAVSILTFVAWMLLTRHFEQALRSAIAVLVISCPCALGLATPTAITVGIGRGAKMGILFRSAEALEKLCGTQTVVFDKTGTITEGKPSVTKLYAYGQDTKTVLTYAAAVERLSSHPLALAVQRAAEDGGLELPDVTSFESIVGVGAQGYINGMLCRVGKPDANMRQKIKDAAADNKNSQKIKVSCQYTSDGACAAYESVAFADSEGLFSDFSRLENEGKTAIVVSLDGVAIGVIGISDRIRADSREAVSALKSLGVRCLMLTGDNERTAAFVAQETNLDGFYASLLPEDKERRVKELSDTAPCAMVGDGINDSPALVRADVGIAIGAGTEVAIDSAGVVLSKSSLKGVFEAYSLSRATIRIIKQNLFWALFYNAICIPIAAGVFYPLFGWQLSPMLASAAMSFSSVCVVSNALRLKKISLEHPHSIEKKQKKASNQPTNKEDNMLFKKNTTTEVIGVEGMMCQKCVAHVKTALESVKGVQDVQVSLEEKTATVTGSASLKALTDAIIAAGYEVR